MKSNKDEILQRLNNYVERIESYNSDFSMGFWFSKDSRAISRQANYLLAKRLIQELSKPQSSINELFSKNIIVKLRNEEIEKAGLSSVSQKIGSRELIVLLNTPIK